MEDIRNISDWTDEELVNDFYSDSGIYNGDVLKEICHRADMDDEWEEANGDTFERVVQNACYVLGF